MAGRKHEDEMDLDLNTVQNELSVKYPNKKITVIPYGHSMPMRVYVEHINIWLNAKGNVRKIDIH